jgi:hypothetical protein
LFLFFETGSRGIAQADLKFGILSPQSPKCWDYRCAPTLQAPTLLLMDIDVVSTLQLM